MKNESSKFSSLKFFTFLATLLLSLSFASFASADETTGNNYSINIVKYKLSEEQLSSSTLPQSPTGSALGSDEAKDSSGHALEVMSGVRYQIDKVVPNNDSTNPFELAPDNQAQVITTDANGQASVHLAAGIYRVTELTGNGITQAAAPIIIQLPLTLQNGQVLNDVFIYPKSSVSVTPGTSTPGHPDTNGTTPSNDPSMIPNTAENIDSSIAVYGILGAVVLLGLYGLFIKPSKIS